MLPVDPYAWSNEDGAVSVRREDVTLPSQEWVWHEDWKVDDHVRGHKTDEQVPLVSIRHQRAVVN